MKTSQKNRLRILLNFFARLSQFALLLKEVNFADEERGPRPSSDRDGRIYRRAVPVLK